MGLSDFLNKLNSGGTKAVFDSSAFNDPLATKTSWSPAARGGASFKTRTLKKISQSELHFVMARSAKIFSLVFVIFPLGFIIIGALGIEKLEFNLDTIGFTIVPFAMLAFGLWMYRRSSKIIIFNTRTGYYSKGKKSKDLSLNPKEDKHTFKLEKIKALQLLPERVKGKNSSYMSYEINLVFEDASRYNVVDSGHKASIEKDAVTLSNFLDIPLWNKLTGQTHMPNTVSSSGSYDSLRPHDSVRPSKKSSYSSSSSDNLDEDYDSTKPRKM